MANGRIVGPAGPQNLRPDGGAPAPAGRRTPKDAALRITVPIVVGTRPEAIKLVPIIRALRRSPSFRPVVVATGQHNRMVAEVFALAKITTDAQLWVGDAHAPLNERVSTVMRRFDDFLRERFGADGAGVATPHAVVDGFPGAVIVHGDTSSAMAAALAAFHLRIPVLHVEAGLRVGQGHLTPFPEELNRQLISRIASLHFAPTTHNLENLIRENVSADRVFVTGNTGIDALRWASRLPARFDDGALQQLHDGDRRLVVVTAHRRENWGEGLAGIAEGVRRLALAQPEVGFVVPLHPNPQVRESLSSPLRESPNVLLTEPLPYAQFAALLGRCHLVITDSGGIQEEAPALGTPVLVTRETTERVEGLEAGTLLLVGSDPGRIAREGARLLTDAGAHQRMTSAPNPYGDGRAAQRIVAALEYVTGRGPAPVPFGPGFDRLAVIRDAGYDADPVTGVDGLGPTGEPAGLPLAVAPWR